MGGLWTCTDGRGARGVWDRETEAVGGLVVSDTGAAAGRAATTCD